MKSKNLGDVIVEIQELMDKNKLDNGNKIIVVETLKMSLYKEFSDTIKIEEFTELVNNIFSIPKKKLKKKSKKKDKK